MLAGRALEFRDRSRRIGERQRREAEEARRMAPDRRRQSRVGLARDLLRLFGVELFDAGRRQRQGLHVDPRRIHRRDAAVTDVEEIGDQIRQPAAGPLRPLLQLAARDRP